jgi:hypothetical protein
MAEKFSGPLVRPSRCEVRDHINYRKNDRWPLYRFYRALQRQKSPMRYIREGEPRVLEFFNTIGQKQTSPGTALLFRQPSLSQADEKPFTVFWTAERSDEPRVAQGQSR